MKKLKLNIVLVLFIFSLFGFSSYGQGDSDSLLNSLSGAKDSTKLNILAELIEENLTLSLEKSLEFAFQSLEIANYNDNQLWISDAYTKIGQIYFKAEMFPEALDYYLKSEKIAIQLKDTTHILKSFQNLGQAYLKLDNTFNSLNYLTSAMELNDEFGDSLLSGKVYKDVADFYMATNQDSEAFKYYNLSLIFLENTDVTMDIIHVLSAMGDLKRKSGDTFSARILYFRALRLAANNVLLYEQAQIAHKVGQVFMDEKNYNLASSHLMLALGISNDKAFLDLSVKITKTLSQLSEMDGKYWQALNYRETYNELKDSLRKVNQQKYLSYLNMKYDADRKDHELGLLSKANDINLIQLQKQKRIRKFTIISVILLSIIALISVVLFTYNKRMSTILTGKRKMLEKAHQDLLQSEEDLKKINDTKNKIFSILAHDLINPFNALLGFASLLNEESQYLNKSEIKQYSGIIHKTASNLHQLLENLLEWSRSQTGQIITDKKFIDLNIIVKEVLDLVIINAEAKSILINTTLSDNCVAYIDKNLIASALRNIVQNAIKFSSEKNEINIQTYTSDGKVIVEVADKGIGISLEDQRKLFRTDTHFSTRGTSNEQGTGLGLIIANDFVELNDGKLEMKSKVGKGSIFTISIPK